MSLFFRIAYGVGFKPWERTATQPEAAAQIAGLLDREQQAHGTPPGRALDLGCGTGYWSVQLASRGWQVTGIDQVPKAVVTARERAQKAGADVRILKGDMTKLRAVGVAAGVDFFWDFGAFHGLAPGERTAVGREVTALAAPHASLLMFAWLPGRHWPLPRGVDRADIETAFPDWQVTGEDAFTREALPPRLKDVAPRWYRLVRG